ncbi:hypothetical protein ES705_29657 [subsurface metagenome]
MVQQPLFPADILPVGKSAKALGISRWTVYRWVRTGKLLGYRLGGFLFIPKSEIKRFNHANHK